MARPLSIRPRIFLTLAALAAPALVSAQQGVSTGDWTIYGGDPGHTRYSSLDQIDASNAANLEIAWQWTGRNFGTNPFITNETTPLFVNGMLYATVGNRRDVVAIDPGTGETLWVYRINEDDRLDNAPRPNSGRGVAYWSDGNGDDRILVETPGFHLAALNAKTGRPVPGFADNGVLDLNKDHRTREGISAGGHDRIELTPDRGGQRDRGRLGAARGNAASVEGEHARRHPRLRRPHGRLLWTFHTIPEQGEAGSETWLEDSEAYSGNAGAWAPISYDAETGYVYLPTEAATGDYYGGHRHGINLFSTSVVCLDSKTGKMVWYFQTIHHDIWDWDNPTVPILADVTVDGTPRKIVAQLTKQGFVYVLDRMTGKPIWPIEEKPVPQTDVPGEWTSPTQPIPSKPAPYERQGFSEDDLLDFTPEIKAKAEEVAKQYRWGPIFSPPSLRDAADGTHGTLTLPSSTGGANWEGGALDPETGILYVGSQTAPSFLSLVPGGDDSDMNYVAGGGRGQVAPGVGIVKPPWGRITAINLNTGDHVWMVPNGDTPDYVAERLGLDPSQLPAQTGKASRAGVLVTKTLLFAGEGQNGDPVFWARDKATGATIAKIDLPGTQSGLPMTYMYDGHQYIVVAVSARGEPSKIVALTLPN